MPPYLKDDLNKIVTSCFVMATVDYHIDDSEIDPVINFIKDNWNAEYGDMNELAEVAKNKAFELLHADSLMDELDAQAQALGQSLNDTQKADVLSLLSTIMNADGEQKAQELEMFKIFVRYMYDSEVLSAKDLREIIKLLLARG